jgi:hypothetical protein
MNLQFVTEGFNVAAQEEVHRCKVQGGGHRPEVHSEPQSHHAGTTFLLNANGISSSISGSFSSRNTQSICTLNRQGNK